MTENTEGMKDQGVVPLEALTTDGDSSPQVGGWWPYLQQRPRRRPPDEPTAHDGHEREG